MMIVERLIATFAISVALAFSAAIVQAADATFVGVLALAVDDDVAKQLGLSAEAKEKLLALIDERETEVISAGLDKLPDDERAAKLADFAAESEKKGLALLTDAQQAKLMQLRVARGGLSTLENAQVAEAVGLSDAQRSNVTKMLASLRTKLNMGTEAERRVAKAEVERELAKILSKEQRAAWHRLAGLAEEGPTKPPMNTVAATDEEKPETTTGDTKPATTTPGTTKPETTKPSRPELVKPSPPKNLDDVRLRFNFSYTPWKDVLEWFAREADLSLDADPVPPGTFNYKDNRSYTPAQALDLMNSVLLRRGYTLIRRDRMLFVFNLEDGIPPGFARHVQPEELDKFGEYELVGCLFTLDKAAPEDLEADVRKILGPQGSLVVLTKSKQLYVQEVAGKLRTIRSIVEALEDPTRGKEEKIATYKLKHKLPEEVMAAVRPLMGIPEGLSSTPDGSLRLAFIGGGNIMATGKADRVERFESILKQADAESEDGDVPTTVETPQLMVYPITTSDPDAVLQVLRTLLAGQLNVRIDKDPKTGSIVAHATPSQHDTIKATIDEMQKDKREVEVIKLRKIDPEVALVAINKLFGIADGAAAGSGPVVVADATTMQLQIRASHAQVEQIRELLTKMGETPAGAAASDVERSYVRTINLSGRARTAALEQLQAAASAYLPNPIRVVTPGGSNKSESDDVVSPRVPVPRDFDRRKPSTTATKPKTEEKKPEEKPSESREERDRREGDSERRDGERDRRDERRSASAANQRWHYVAWQDPETKSNSGDASAKDAADEPPPKQKSIPGAEIVITVTPTGIVVSSQDLDALDEVEQLLRGFETGKSSGKEYTVFYLRFAKADVASQLLQEALGGGSGEDGGGGGSLMGDLASSMLGGGMGGIMGAMMGGGGAGGGSASGPVLLIPDNRVNAIIAQGRPEDLDLAEQLLKFIDRQASPEEVQTVARPRFIPVIHSTAEEMATIVRQVYANRMAADSSQPRQPSPQELIQALRGGGRGRGAGGADRKSEEQKMTVGVDLRSNSLIVSAPEALYEEVRAMVEELDIASTQKDEVVEVVSLEGTNAQLIERSLTSILGDNVSITRQGGTTQGMGRPGQRTGNRPGGAAPPVPPQANAQQAQQMGEIMRAIQGAGGGGGRGNRGGGGGPGGGARGGR
jgi:type II secretory pathway component GspD/PulD (secretin)